MRVGVDIDGVLADFNRAYISRVQSVTGRDLFPPNYEPTTWNYPEALGYTNEEVARVWESIKNDRVFWYSLSEYPDTQAAMDYLSGRVACGDDVYYITARPGIDAKKQTEMWLMARLHRSSLHRWEVPTVLITSHKGLAARTLGLDVYIDDRLENAMDVNTTGCKTFLMDRSWNRNYNLADEIVRTDTVVGICG